MKPLRRLTVGERLTLTAGCEDLERSMAHARRVIGGATTATQVRQVVAALIHDARLLSRVLDEIERAPGKEG